jgi:hypothetical protein
MVWQVLVTEATEITLISNQKAAKNLKNQATEELFLILNENLIN